MKNIQKYLSALLALAMAAPVFTGCSDDYEYSLSSVVAKPSDKFNARIQFVSRLSDGALITGDADYTALNNYMVNTLKSREEAWLTVFDRSDNANLDKVMQIPLDGLRLQRADQQDDLQGQHAFLQPADPLGQGHGLRQRLLRHGLLPADGRYAHRQG
mgnify:CR=1 FL=1